VPVSLRFFREHGRASQSFPADYSSAFFGTTFAASICRVPVFSQVRRTLTRSSLFPGKRLQPIARRREQQAPPALRGLRRGRLRLGRIAARTHHQRRGDKEHSRHLRRITCARGIGAPSLTTGRKNFPLVSIYAFAKEKFSLEAACRQGNFHNAPLLPSLGAVQTTSMTCRHVRTRPVKGVVTAISSG